MFIPRRSLRKKYQMGGHRRWEGGSNGKNVSNNRFIYTLTCLKTTPSTRWRRALNWWRDSPIAPSLLTISPLILSGHPCRGRSSTLPSYGRGGMETWGGWSNSRGNWVCLWVPLVRKLHRLWNAQMSFLWYRIILCILGLLPFWEEMKKNEKAPFLDSHYD